MAKHTIVLIPGLVGFVLGYVTPTPDEPEPQPQGAPAGPDQLALDPGSETLRTAP